MTDWMYVDVKALLRIAQVFDIPIANNIATADFMIHSSLMNEQYSHQIENFKNAVAVASLKRKRGWYPNDFQSLKRQPLICFILQTQSLLFIPVNL